MPAVVVFAQANAWNLIQHCGMVVLSSSLMPHTQATEQGGC